MTAYQLTEGFSFYFRETSDLMEWVGYDPEFQYLQIVFKDKTQITYSGVNQNVAQTLISAGGYPKPTTPDLYYSSAIKNSYPTVSA